MKREEIEAKTESLLTPIIQEHGFELVDVEYVKEGSSYYLRAYIDKPGGITIDDCEVVSRAFSDILDRDDYIDESYIMEISSPGLGRPLKKDKDFARSMGEEIEIKTYTMKAFPFYKGKSKEFEGTLVGYENGRVTIRDEKDNELIFEKNEIALVRLAIDF